MNNIDYKKLSSDLIELFRSYHSLLTVPINGTVWENLLFNSLSKQSDDVIWNNGSHEIGTDIKFNNIRISCKGGRIKGTRKDRLKISSYRTTTYKTLEEKLDFFEDKHEDVYFCLTYKETDRHEYKLFTFDANILDYRSLKWKETKKEWKGIGTFTANIKKAMSDQLWLSLPIKLITEQFYFGIEKDDKYYRMSNNCNAERLCDATLEKHFVIGET